MYQEVILQVVCVFCHKTGAIYSFLYHNYATNFPGILTLAVLNWHIATSGNSILYFLLITIKIKRRKEEEDGDDDDNNNNTKMKKASLKH